MKTRTVFQVLLILFLVACGTVPASQPTVKPADTLAPSTPANALPDLVVSSMYLGMQGIPDTPNCVPAYGAYEIRAIIENRGAAPAANVVAVEQSTGQQMQIGTLQPMQSITVSIPLKSTSGSYTVVLDPQNRVVESNENNNVFTYLAPTPTPPLLCSPTPGTPVPTLPPVAPTPLSLNGLIYADMNLAQMWKVLPGEQPTKLLDGTFAQFSPDGTQALFEQSGDLWLAEPMDNPGRNLTNTPDRLETAPQWWPANPSRIIFNTVGVNEAQEKGWTHSVLGYVAMMNRDGSELVNLAEVPSLTRPALSPDGKTIAYDRNGWPALYVIGEGKQSFDPTLYGYPFGNPDTGVFYTSPSFSPDGRFLTWWVSDDESKPQRNFSLVTFDLVDKTSSTPYSYTALGGTLGWLDNPIWSPNGNWIAFQTRGEKTPRDLWFIHAGGGMGQRFGLATNPVWSPDSKWLAFVQWPPRSDSYLAAYLSVMDVPGSNIQQTKLPVGSIPLAWMGTAPTP